MWGEADPSEVRQVWGDGLGRFDAVDLRSALDAMPAVYTDYPPTLPQFVGLCLDARRSRASVAVKLPGPRTEMPDAIRAQLRAFVAAHKA
jgi:hypothetical protein